MKGLIALGGDLDISFGIAPLAENHEVWIAADSGFRHYQNAGLMPQHTIGDLDSTVDWYLGKTIIHHEPDQNSSDVDKALALAGRLGVQSVTLVAGQGPRVDHLLGILHSLAQSELNARVVFATEVAYSVREHQTVVIPTVPHEVISAMPITSATLSLSGVAWPLEREQLALGGLISLSNRATEDHVLARCHSGFAMLFVPSNLGRASADVWSD